MTHHWDEFSKSLAQPVPRRESLRRLGAVFAGAVLSPLALGAAWARPPADPCKTFCNQCPKQQRSQCLAACQACSGNTSRLCGTCGNYTCCASGLACCGGACVDLFDDSYNCGGCGNVCGGYCDQGVCFGPVCGPGTDFNWDSSNCGFCGNVCPWQTFCVWGVCNGGGGE